MPRSHATTRKPSRGGFTLLEVVLSLGLATLLLVLMGAAIDVYFRVLDYGRTEVEEAQLSRTLLQMIAADLRNTVKPGSATDESEDDDFSLAVEETDLFNASPVLGLFGDATHLQMDVGLLPRGTRGLTGGIKTVMYYVADETTTTMATDRDGQELRGLVRQEFGRGTAMWSVRQGQLDEFDVQPQLLAPEVARIEFRYSDGLGWFDQWDSAELESLPAAVEIALAITPSFKTDEDEEKLLVYRLLVRIPTAEDVSASSLDEEMED